MALKLGSSTVGSLYLGSHKVSDMYLGSHKVYSSGAPALAPKSMRMEFYTLYLDVPPTSWDIDTAYTDDVWFTHVSGNVYDFHCNREQWVKGTNSSLFDILSVYNAGGSKSLPMSLSEFEILDGDLTGVTTVHLLFGGAKMIHKYQLRNTGSLTDVSAMFYHRNGMAYLEEISLFDTSSVTNFSGMFNSAINGTNEMSIPLFDTSSATDVTAMFRNTRKITGGHLALYQQMSTQSNPPTTYTNCFTNCGSGTTTGAAELAQIPSSWGGTMA